jgi:hypothetical protein
MRFFDDTPVRLVLGTIAYLSGIVLLCGAGLVAATALFASPDAARPAQQHVERAGVETTGSAPRSAAAPSAHKSRKPAWIAATPKYDAPQGSAAAQARAAAQNAPDTARRASRHAVRDTEQDLERGLERPDARETRGGNSGRRRQSAWQQNWNPEPVGR